MSVALDLLNSYVATAKDIGQLMYDLAEGISSKSNTQNYWDVKWNFCSFLGGWRGTNPTEVIPISGLKWKLTGMIRYFEIKLVSKIDDIFLFQASPFRRGRRFCLITIKS